MSANRNFYENWHGGRRLQKRIVGSNNFTYRNLIRMIERFGGDANSVLDVGCGVGTIDFYLATQGKRVTGIEISKKALDVAKENARLFGLDQNIRFVKAVLPTKKTLGEFDLVICSEVIEHVKDDKDLVKEIAKNTKPGGIVILSTPSVNAPLYRWGRLNKYDRTTGHLRRYTVQELRNIFRESGLTVIHTEKTEGVIRNLLFTNNRMGKLLRFIRGPFSDLVTTIDNLVIPLFGESQFYIVARK